MMQLQQLNELLAHATASGRAYRRIYGMENDAPILCIPSLSDWQNIPLLSKSDLLGIPLAERSFLPMSEVDYIAASSGTTGTLPLFSPRTHVLEYEFRHDIYRFSGAALSSKLVPHQQELFLSAGGVPAPVVVLDPRNTAVSVRLAQDAGVESIFAFLYHIPLIIEHMVRACIGEQIRFVEVAGHTCSRSMYDTMRSAFPHAIIISTYGISEVERSPIGLPCNHMSETHYEQHYHAKLGCYLELLDIENGRCIAPEKGREGELVVTSHTAEPSAFPMIRYRTGDKVRVVDTKCDAHGDWSFSVLGRLETDFIKIPGGALNAHEIERVLGMHRDSVTDIFEAHLYQEPAGDRVRLVLHLQPRTGTDLEALVTDMSEQLRIGPDSTYADCVRAGLCSPIELTALAPDLLRKPKRIVRH